MIAFAQGHKEAALSFVDKVNSIILYPIITLLMAVAVLIFLWGCFEYVLHGDDDHARSQGAKHMLWGVIGLVVMISAVAIMNIALATFGLGNVDQYR